MSGLSASCRPAASKAALCRNRVGEHLRAASGRAGSQNWMAESPELEARSPLGRHARVITSLASSPCAARASLTGSRRWQGLSLGAQRPDGCPREGADPPAAAGDVFPGAGGQPISLQMVLLGSLLGNQGIHGAPKQLLFPLRHGAGDTDQQVSPRHGGGKAGVAGACGNAPRQVAAS